MTYLLCAVCSVSGGTTRLDAVTDEATNGDGTEQLSCDEPSASRFILSGESGCLPRTEADMMLDEPTFRTELSADCSTARARWDLTPALAGTFSLRNVESQLSLDVPGAADVPGTPIILYDPYTLDKPAVLAPLTRPYGLRAVPRHAPLVGAEARDSRVEIWPA